MSTWAKAAKRKYADGGAVDDDHADDVPADDEQSMDETTPAGQRSKLERMLAGMNLPSETNVSGAATGMNAGLDPSVSGVPQDRTLSSSPGTATMKAPRQVLSSQDNGASGVPTTSQGNVLDMRQQLQNYLQQQGGGIDHMQQLANQYQQQLAQENNRPNRSALYALADHYYGTNFSKALPPPTPASGQTAEVMKANDQVQKERQPMTSDLLKEYSSDNNSVSKAQVAYLQTQAKIARDQARGIASSVDTGMTDDTGNKIILNAHQAPIADKMHQAMFLGRGSNMQVQQSIAKLRSGAQFENLIAAIPKGQPTPQDMADLTSALGQTVNGTNILTDHRFAGLYPGGAPLSAAGVAQWLTGDPHGVNQTKWINRMLNEVQAEKAGANKTLGTWVDSQEDYYGSTGLPPAFVHHGAQAAKSFYNHGYEPVAGVGKFVPTGAQQPDTTGVKMKNGVPYKFNPAKNTWDRVK
jgi:hypothetical protein